GNASCLSQVTRVGGDKRFPRRHPVLTSGPSPRTSGLPFQAGFVALEKIDIVRQHDELVSIETARNGGAQSALAILQAPEVCIQNAETIMPNPKIRVQFDRFPRLR